MLYLTCARHRTIFGSTSYNQVSRFLKEIPDELITGYEAIETNYYDDFEDVGREFNYGKLSSYDKKLQFGT